mmetsp:Transcript_34018/g.118974  ORF Transcript_34018/g.118974 Transcript_34018/m.118974 type:complete len:474 (+) Transcript_34018:147-1568(+)
MTNAVYVIVKLYLLVIVQRALHLQLRLWREGPNSKAVPGYDFRVRPTARMAGSRQAAAREEEQSADTSPARGEGAPDEAQAAIGPAKWNASNHEQRMAAIDACERNPVYGPYKPGAVRGPLVCGDNVAPYGQRKRRTDEIGAELLALSSDEHKYGISVGDTTLARWVPQVIDLVIALEKTVQRDSGAGDRDHDDEFHNAVKAYHDQCLQLLEGKGMSAAEKRKAEAAKSNMDDMVRGQQAAAAAGMNTEHKGPGKRARANARPASLAGGAASEVEFDLSDDEFDDDDDEAYYDGGRAGDDSPTGVHRAPDANAGGALMPNGAAVLQAALPRVRAPTQPQSPKRRGSFLELVVVLKTSADAEAAASAKQVELDARRVAVQEQAEKRLTAQQDADAARAKAEGVRLELEAKAAIEREERRDVQSAKTHDMFAKLLQSSMAGSVTERLKKLKAIYDDGTISKAVYDKKEAQLLEEL